ncbi:MAG TPA: hypothetical protein VG675_04775 [Bryobacteraceae bacterium]|nr:hypothetical protein [Bryobacteraceae bacterium]
MTKHTGILFCAAVLTATTAFAQYKMEPISTAPPNLPAAYASLVQSQGYRITGPDGPWCDIWFRKTIPTGPKSDQPSVAFPTIQQGTFLGILQFPGKGADRRGQTINAGVYTLRYSLNPVNGDHGGIAPQRDFALMTPIANDTDPNAMPTFEALVAMSTKASNSPHPAVLELEPPLGTTFPAFAKEGDHDWPLSVKIGDLAISIILAGQVET